MTARTIEHIKRRFIEEGLEAALRRKPQQRKARAVTFDGALEARLIALACSEAPSGRRRWTVRLQAEKAVEVGLAPSVSPMTVRTSGSQKRRTRASLEAILRLPPRGSAAFVACMQGVLAVFARPCEARRPVVCMDETNKQLIGEAHQKLPVRPGQPE